MVESDGGALGSCSLDLLFRAAAAPVVTICCGVGDSDCCGGEGCCGGRKLPAQMLVRLGGSRWRRRAVAAGRRKHRIGRVRSTSSCRSRSSGSVTTTGSLSANNFWLQAHPFPALESDCKVLWSPREPDATTWHHSPARLPPSDVSLAVPGINLGAAHAALPATDVLTTDSCMEYS
jgi:hypothetical protein